MLMPLFVKLTLYGTAFAMLQFSLMDYFSQDEGRQYYAGTGDWTPNANFLMGDAKSLGMRPRPDSTRRPWTRFVLNPRPCGFSLMY